MRRFGAPVIRERKVYPSCEAEVLCRGNDLNFVIHSCRLQTVDDIAQLSGGGFGAGVVNNIDGFDALVAQ